MFWIGGHDRKKQREAELGTKKGELEKEKIERDAKLVLKEAAEAPEKEALDAIKAEGNRLKQIKEEADRVAREEAALVSSCLLFFVRCFGRWILDKLLLIEE